MRWNIHTNLLVVHHAPVNKYLIRQNNREFKMQTVCQNGLLLPLA